MPIFEALASNTASTADPPSESLQSRRKRRPSSGDRENLDEFIAKNRRRRVVDYAEYSDSDGDIGVDRAIGEDRAVDDTEDDNSDIRQSDDSKGVITSVWGDRVENTLILPNNSQPAGTGSGGHSRIMKRSNIFEVL